MTPKDERAPERVALVGSVALLLIGLWLLARPDAYPFGPGDRFADMSLMAEVPPTGAAAFAVASGALASVTAGLAAVGSRHSRVVNGLALAVAVPMAVTYGYVVPDIQILILIAYLLALSLPSIAVFFLSARRAAGRQVLRSALLAAGWAFVLTVSALLVLGRPWEWGDEETGGFSPHRPVLLLASVLLGIAWAVVGVRSYRALRARCVGCGRPGPSWTSAVSAARWGRIFTWAAALTPMPYVLARLTWLTPWPYGESADNLAGHPGLWVFGLALAAAGELGTWLTLGLVRRRGEYFPGWLPGWGGASVPVMVAVVPGLAVALLMCVGGHSVVQQAFGPGTTWEDHSLVVLVPLPLWGPLLAVATLGYWYRRRPACSHAR